MVNLDYSKQNRYLQAILKIKKRKDKKKESFARKATKLKIWKASIN